jgi:hypothetical protein
LAAALLYGALSLAMLAPGLLPGKTISTADSLFFAPPWSAVRPATLHRPANNELGDAVVQFQPFAAYAPDRMCRMFLASARFAVLGTSVTAR